MELWPQYQRCEDELGPLCYQLVKVSTIQRQGKKGGGVKKWCEDNDIDRNRFYYLVKKYTPENERKPASSLVTRFMREQQKKRQAERDVEDFVEISTESSGDLSQVLGFVQDRLVTLPVQEQLVQLDWLIAQLKQLRDKTQTQVSAVNAQKQEVTGVYTTNEEVTTDGPEAA